MFFSFAIEGFLSSSRMSSLDSTFSIRVRFAHVTEGVAKMPAVWFSCRLVLSSLMLEPTTDV